MERTVQLSSEQNAKLHAALVGMKLLAADVPFAAKDLAGGVSCDVWLITTADGRKFVVKQALAKLRVSADWRAPQARSTAEVAWLRLVRDIDAALVPKVLAEDASRHIFATEYLPAEIFPLWKRDLAAGRAEAHFAASVGAALAKIHGATAGREEIVAQFTNQAQFHALRLEPYLLYTAQRHSDLATQLHALADGIAAAHIALMHGDVSPKNILHGPVGPVFLDAETACYGDPAFDLAFCLNHLLLKCVWHPEFTRAYLDCFSALTTAYLRGVMWENADHVARRATALLPALMLSRIDGKSPVEYIVSDFDREFVRRFACQHVAAPLSSLEDLSGAWSEALMRR